MKFLNEELSEWKAYDSPPIFPVPNWYRLAGPWPHRPGYDIQIGLIQDPVDGVLLWCFDAVIIGEWWEVGHQFNQLWDAKNGIEKHYPEAEIESAKQEIDKFILQFNNLKAFL